MQIHRGQGNENFRFFSDDLVGRIVREREMEPSISSDILSIPSGVNYIEHRVSRMDTLAGIAIKYGVEVSDIKRLNGLMTDLQMFAHNSLQIPLPGRHALSHNHFDSVSPRESGPEIDVLTSFQSLKMKSPQRGVSPAMSNLQGYYGLTPPSHNKGATEGTEMAVYTRGTAQNLEDAPQHKKSPLSDPPPSQHRRHRSLVNGLPLENGGLAEEMLVAKAGGSEAQKSNEKLEQTRTPEMLLRDDNSSGGFSGITGKSLALRPKSLNRADPSADTDSGRMNPIPMGNTFMCEGFSVFRKSSSTSNLHDSKNSGSIWPTSKLSKRCEMSTGSSTRPIFDGLPKPVTIRRNKAALD